MRVFADLAEFRNAVGEDLGTSSWITVSQEQVNAFADATGDQQWIHVDPERAADGPFGGTIAHGYLTLSLIPSLARSLYRIDDLAMGVNYGAEKVRFPHPVRVGSKIRAKATLAGVKDVSAGTQALIAFTVELEGVSKPACVAEVLYVYAAA